MKLAPVHDRGIQTVKSPYIAPVVKDIHMLPDLAPLVQNAIAKSRTHPPKQGKRFTNMPGLPIKRELRRPTRKRLQMPANVNRKRHSKIQPYSVSVPCFPCIPWFHFLIHLLPSCSSYSVVKGSEHRTRRTNRNKMKLRNTGKPDQFDLSIDLHGQ
jgi:hypothetical protein